LKSAIAFAVVRCLYRNGWEVFAITSQNRHRVYGREADGRISNRSPRDVLASFSVEANAAAAVIAAQETWNAWAPEMDKTQRAADLAKSHRDTAVRQALADAVERSGACGAQPPAASPDAPPGLSSRACDMPA